MPCVSSGSDRRLPSCGCGGAQGRALAQGVKRINVGGKLLTNLLKETVSFTKVGKGVDPDQA